MSGVGRGGGAWWARAQAGNAYIPGLDDYVADGHFKGKTQSIDGDGCRLQGTVAFARQAASVLPFREHQAGAINGKRGAVRPRETAGVGCGQRMFDDLGERYRQDGRLYRILKLGVA